MRLVADVVIHFKSRNDRLRGFSRKAGPVYVYLQHCLMKQEEEEDGDADGDVSSRSGSGRNRSRSSRSISSATPLYCDVTDLVRR